MILAILSVLLDLVSYSTGEKGVYDYNNYTL